MVTLYTIREVMLQRADDEYVRFEDYQKAIAALDSLLKAAKLLQECADNYGIGPIDTDIIDAAEEVLAT